MGLGDRLIGYSAFLLLDWLAITVLSLIYWLIIGKTLPPDIYGITATAINIILILSSITLLGLHTTLIKLISEFRESNQNGKIRNIIRFSMKWSLGFSVVTAGILIIGSKIFSPLLNLPVEIVIISGVGVFLLSLLTITNSILYGMQNMKRLMKTNFIGNLIKVIVTLILILSGFIILGPLIGLLISIISIIFLRIDFLLLAKKTRESIKAPRLDYKSIFKYSLSGLIAAVAMMGFSNTPNIILNVLTDPFNTGLFAITLTITSPILSIPGVLNSALFPITSGLSIRKGGRITQRSLINTVVKYASLIIMPLIAILMLFSGTIILFFSSGTFLSAVQFLPIVGVAAFFFGIGNILNTSIYAARKPVASRNIIIVTMLVFLAISIPLSIMMSALGMAIAYLISMAIFCFSNVAYLKKFMNLNIDVKSILKIFVATLVFSGVAFGIDLIIENIILKLIMVVLSLALYMLVLIPLKFYQKEDLKILENLSRRSPFLRNFFHGLHSFLEKHV
jgi:O-antigen/teichoic acid export membrane protein